MLNSSKNNFIKKAQSKYGDKYNYDKIEYINCKVKVEIYCKKCKKYFWQTPDRHLQNKKSCDCTNKKVNQFKKVSKEDIFEKFRKTHGDKYDYSKFEYVDTQSKSLIVCKKCKYEFEKRPYCHIKGQGCPKCSFIKKKNFIAKKFVEKAKSFHGEKYSYDKVDYINNQIKVTIHCNTCDEDFEQQPGNHLMGQGCKKCAYNKTLKYQRENPTGWRYSDWKLIAEKSKHFDSFKIYVIECYNDKERFIKIGRTYTSIKMRFQNKTLMPYNYKILKEIIFNDAKECCEQEWKLKNKYKEYKYLPLIKFGGMHECFESSKIVEL